LQQLQPVTVGTVAFTWQRSNVRRTVKHQYQSSNSDKSTRSRGTRQAALEEKFLEGILSLKSVQQQYGRIDIVRDAPRRDSTVSGNCADRKLHFT
ncbi:MAG TPA: hypothetical protein DDY41_18235, partial [Arthrobacter bacterium]|nr:hypothetical protein [Arthrobacter sp.]